MSALPVVGCRQKVLEFRIEAVRLVHVQHVAGAFDEAQPLNGNGAMEDSRLLVRLPIGRARGRQWALAIPPGEWPENIV
jgi:hypothetical protein